MEPIKIKKVPDLLSRRGRFSISRALLEDNPEPLIEVMAKIIVIRAEFMFDRQHFEYIALSKEFRKVDDGMLSPEYEILWHTEKDGSFRIEFKERL